MKILITGASGLVGGAVLERLCAIPQNTVLSLMRKASGAATRCCDLAHDDLESVLKHDSIDAIVHCAAAIPQPGLTDEWVYQQNRMMDEEVARYCSRHACRLVFTSSVAVYQDFSGRVNDENAPVQADTLYQRGKLASETRIRAQCPSYAILRIPSPYGPRQTHATVLKLFIEKAVRNEPIGYYGDGGRTQNFIHVRDIAAATEMALMEEQSDIYNIASAQAISMKELANLVTDIARQNFGSTSYVTPVPKPDVQESYRANICIDKACSLLKWYPEVRLCDGVFDWMRQLYRNDAAFIGD